MSYYTKHEMIDNLNRCPQFREYLYCRGFLITSNRNICLTEYPFYSNWKKLSIDSNFSLFFHKSVTAFVNCYDDYSLFIVGHAYNPFTMNHEESIILDYLYSKLLISEESFWDAEGELTGVFCIGFVKNNQIVFSTDCAGMQLVNYGVVEHNLYVTSHSKLVSDITGIEQDRFISRMVKNKFWHFWGTWLPGDLSPYKELKRLVPNCCARFDISSCGLSMNRYYPVKTIDENNDESYYFDTIKLLSTIMTNSLELITRKWNDVSISVTGGRDSMTTLACANGLYDKFSYFSYISNDDESVDAYAATDILNSIGLNNKIISIPNSSDLYSDIDVFSKVLECNAGCIGSNNENDVRKRLYFCYNPPCNVEVKSWVNEIGRGRCYDRFAMKRFPNAVSPKYWRAMHKAYIYDFKLIKETNRIFSDYINKYYGNGEFDKLFWLIYYHWEFSWAGGEGVFLTAEQRVPYEITIPFNNRRYLELMLTIPLEKRKKDFIPKSIISYKNKKIADTNIVINDVSHTKVRAIIERIHLELYSRI